MNEKLLPIVAGCRAVILPHGNGSVPAWAEVTVGEYAEYIDTDEVYVEDAWRVTLDDGRKGAITAKYLMRIDGGHNEEEKQECKALEVLK